MDTGRAGEGEMGSGRGVDEAEEFADGVGLFDGVAQRPLGVDFVHVPPAHALPGDVAGLYQVAHDALGGSLGDAHPLGDFAQAYARVTRDAEQDVAVVGEEGPIGGSHVARSVAAEAGPGKCSGRPQASGSGGAAVDAAELLVQERRCSEGLDGCLPPLGAPLRPPAKARANFGDDGEEGRAAPGEGGLEDALPAGDGAGERGEDGRGGNDPVPHVPHAGNIGRAAPGEQAGGLSRGPGRERQPPARRCGRRRTRG